MKKNILFINGHLNVGGCERSLVDVLKNIDYNKYKVELLLLEDLGDYINEIPNEVKVWLYSLNEAFGRFVPCMKRAINNRDFFSLGFRFIYILGKKVNSRFFCFLRPLFKKLSKSYDIIIAYRPGICTDLAAYTFVGKKKISWWHHGEMNYFGKELENLHKAYYKMSRIVAVSESSATLVADVFPDISNRICVIPNMICIEELRFKAIHTESIDLSVNKLTLISVGRMSPEKNMVLCPRIAECLKKKGINFSWILIGNGVEEKKIATMINQLDLQNNMVMIGRKNNPYPYMFAADIMVHPSLVESQGITLLESMALGTPVIAVDSKGPQEFIKTGENGYLVENDAEKIAQTIEMLYFNPQLCSIIADNAANDVCRFGVEEIMKKIKKILEG